MIIVDASAVIAAAFPSQNRHEECLRAFQQAEHPILSPFVIAEIDYFLLEYGDVQTELRFLAEGAIGAYEVPQSTADASIVVLAERYGTHDILTLDERHFRALRPITGRRTFRLLPADA